MKSKPEGRRSCLYSSKQLPAVLDAMAAQAAAVLAGKPRVMVVGILRRGAPLADMLYERLTTQFHFSGIARMNLQIKRYADDLQLLHPETQLTEAAEQHDLDLTGICVLLVDDVLYRGHSLLRAVEYLVGKKAAEIRTAVLVDRGITSLPIRSDIVGLRLEVASPDIIECNVPPYESEFKIDLLQPEAESAKYV